MKKYNFNDANKISKNGINDITEFIKQNPKTIEIINVEKDILFQKQDVDLIWKLLINNKPKRVKIEVKIDRYHQTGNYFFETISNSKKQTLGCFLYTCADYIFYYFLKIKELHILKTNLVRVWFLKNQNNFKTISTQTCKTGKVLYKTIGKLVPRNILPKNLGTKVINLGGVVY